MHFIRFSLLYIALIIPVVGLPHGPARIKVVEAIETNAPADKVWTIVRNFCSITDWHPGITACTATDANKPGSIREITLANGEKIKEKLFKHEDDKMWMQYALQAEEKRIIKDLPVATHGVKLSVTATDSGSKIEFKGAFYRAFPGQSPPPELSDAACKEAITQLYIDGLNKIKALAEQ